MEDQETRNEKPIRDGGQKDVQHEGRAHYPSQRDKANRKYPRKAEGPAVDSESESRDKGSYQLLAVASRYGHTAQPERRQLPTKNSHSTTARERPQVKARKPLLPHFWPKGMTVGCVMRW